MLAPTSGKVASGDNAAELAARIRQQLAQAGIAIPQQLQATLTKAEEVEKPISACHKQVSALGKARKRLEQIQNAVAEIDHAWTAFRKEMEERFAQQQEQYLDQRAELLQEQAKAQAVLQEAVQAFEEASHKLAEKPAGAVVSHFPVMEWSNNWNMPDPQRYPTPVQQVGSDGEDLPMEVPDGDQEELIPAKTAEGDGISQKHKLPKPFSRRVTHTHIKQEAKKSPTPARQTVEEAKSAEPDGSGEGK